METPAGLAVEGTPLSVQSRIPLRIATSAIATAGSGIIAEKRIPATDEIFRIPQPVVAVTYGDPIDTNN
jgi:hypothetical protein